MKYGPKDELVVSWRVVAQRKKPMVHQNVT
jgi:hypothetical protein